MRALYLRRGPVVRPELGEGARGSRVGARLRSRATQTVDRREVVSARHIPGGTSARAGQGAWASRMARAMPEVAKSSPFRHTMFQWIDFAERRQHLKPSERALQPIPRCAYRTVAWMIEGQQKKLGEAVRYLESKP